MLKALLIWFAMLAAWVLFILACIFLLVLGMHIHVA